MPTSKRAHGVNVVNHVESLGLQTYGKERQDPDIVIRRLIFKHHPVLKLYRVELPVLFGRLLRDESPAFNRNTSILFEEELDDLLQEYGPQIWPELGAGSRDHLREPREGTRYTSDLVYPRDHAILKQHLSGIVLCKEARPDMDVDAYINKTTKDARSLLKLEEKQLKFPQRLPKERTRHDSTEEKERGTRKRTRPADDDEASDPESDDSVLGTKTRRQTRRKGAHSPDAPGVVELRLYRKTVQVVPPSTGPTWSYGNLMLVTNAMTSDECFARIGEKIESDCSFMIFQLPEDMSTKDRVRIDRGSKESETVFQRVLYTLQKARKFPCGPPHRSVEVQIGLEVSDG